MVATVCSEYSTPDEICNSFAESCCLDDVFPQAALFLEFKDFVRLHATSKGTIPDDWENLVWLSVVNNGNYGFHLSNLDKHTISDLMAHVVYSTLVLDTEPIVVDSAPIAKRLIRLASQTVQANLMPCSSPQSLAMTFLTRFHFDEEDVMNCWTDPLEVAHASPVVFNLGQETCIIELTLHEKARKLSVHNLANEEDEPRPLSQPIRVKLCSMSSPVVLHNEYILTHEDVDESGLGLSWIPSQPEIATKALVEGVVCMVCLENVTLPEGTPLKCANALNSNSK